MAIQVTNKVNLAVKISKIVDGMEATLRKELSDVATEINVRTSSGKDIEGRSFTAYRESTKRKKRSGKTEGSRQTSPVNLTQIGTMLESFGKIKIEKTNSKLVGIIKFSSGKEAQKGKWNQDGDIKKNRPPRPWVGLSEQQITRLLTRLRGK